MKLIVSKDELHEKLSNIQNIVEKKNTMPILSHFLLDAGKDFSFIIATDLQVAIKENLKADVKREGKLCIPARKLFEIVREADGEITLESDEEQWLKVSSGKSRFRLACLAAGEFPAWPGMEKAEEIDFSSQALLEIIEKTLYSAGETDTRYTLNGLLFHIKPGDRNVIVVGTDGHRLALINKPIDASVSEEKKVILPRKAASEVRRFFGNVEKITLVFGKSHILFRIGEAQFLARLIEGSYPDYEKVLPSSNKNMVVADRDGFLKSLKRVSIMSKERSNAVRIDFSEGALSLSSSNPDLGEAKDEIDADYKEEPLSIGFNARYLIDVLSAMTSEKIRFALKDALSPTLLTEEGSEDYKCVIMPMRI